MPAALPHNGPQDMTLGFAALVAMAVGKCRDLHTRAGFFTYRKLDGFEDYLCIARALA